MDVEGGKNVKKTVPHAGYTDRMKESILGWGADLVGVADIDTLKGLRTDPADLLESFTRAISIRCVAREREADRRLGKSA